MTKKSVTVTKLILGTICLIVGGLIMAGAIISLVSNNVKTSAAGGLAEKTGYIFGVVFFGLIGGFLLWMGYRFMKPAKKKRETVNFLGEDL